MKMIGEKENKAINMFVKDWAEHSSKTNPKKQLQSVKASVDFPQSQAS